MNRLLASLGAVLLLGGTAHAHSPVPAVGAFYNGMLHPLITPAHALVLLAVGLLCGQHAPRGSRLALPAFAALLAAGLVLPLPATAAGTMAMAATALLLLAAISGGAVMLGVAPRAAVALIAAGAGFAIGLDTRADAGALLAGADAGIELASADAGAALASADAGAALASASSGAALGSASSGAALGSASSGSALGSASSGSALASANAGTALGSANANATLASADLAGIWLGAVLAVTLVGGLSAPLQRAWQRIGVRALGSWITAASLLVLTLTLSKTTGGH